jgi:hypothetical protein
LLAQAPAQIRAAGKNEKWTAVRSAMLLAELLRAVGNSRKARN